jgi:hypothetical protein
MEPNGIVLEENEKVKPPPRTPSPTLSSTPQEKARDAKAAKIHDACRGGDVNTLRILAISEGGLISDEVRRQAC